MAKVVGAVFARPTIGHTLVAPFAADSDYFAPSPHALMVNLIVDDWTVSWRARLRPG
jgi:hypothetical protein